MSKEYLEREALLERLSYNGPMNLSPIEYYREVVTKFPTEDVAPVVHGRWYDEDSVDAHGSPIYRCSVCNKTVADNYISCHKFCLHCGAYMDGGNSNA